MAKCFHLLDDQNFTTNKNEHQMGFCDDLKQIIPRSACVNCKEGHCIYCFKPVENGHDHFCEEHWQYYLKFDNWCFRCGKKVDPDHYIASANGTYHDKWVLKHTEKEAKSEGLDQY